MIARWNPEIVEATCDFKLPQFAACNPGNVGELPDRAAL
jgi:hypothetical protein